MDSFQDGEGTAPHPLDDIFRHLDKLLAKGSRAPLAELKAQFPGREGDAERAWEAHCRYSSALAEAQNPDARLESLLPPQTRVGDYVIEDLIGRGGVGDVYRAFQPSLNRRVAIKMLRGGPYSRRACDRFREEARTAARLTHASLVPIYEADEWRGRPYYAMRLLAGWSLREVLECLADPESAAGDRPGARWIVERGAETADALSIVHAAGLVHRDVKPENIMVERAPGSGEKGRHLDGRAVLTDFGLAREVWAPRNPWSLSSKGTAAYAAPELLRSGEVGPAADVYSLGVTLHDLLAGRLPASRGFGSEGLESFLQLGVPVDRDLDAIVAKATQPDPARRYPDAGALRDDLRRWLQRLPVQARPLGPVEGSIRWIRRSPGRVLRAGLLALTAVALLWGARSAVLASERLAGARGADERGDLLALCERLERLPPWLPALSGDYELAALARQIQAADSSEPAVAVYRLLRDRRQKDALREAARFLEADGMAAHPRLVRYFLRELPSGSWEEQDAAEAASWALLLAARLGLESPDLSRGASAVSSPLRVRLIEILDAGFARPGRLYATSALAGWGTPDLVPRILAWARRNPADSEERRLGLMCAEYILRRARRCETAALLDSAAAAETARLLFDSLREEPLEHQLMARASARALTALAFLTPDGTGGPIVARWRAALSPDSVLAGLRSKPPRKAPVFGGAALQHRSLPEAAFQLGWCAGASGADAVRCEAELTRTGERLLPGDRAGVDRLIERYRDGVATGALERQGVKPDHESLAPESRLAGRSDPAADWQVRPAPAEVGASATGVIAEWDFGRPSPILRGRATAAWGRQAWLPTDSQRGSMLALKRFGTSQLGMEFELAPEDLGDSSRVVVTHQKALRHYFPYRGNADITVTADGMLVHPGFGVESFSTREDVVLRIPQYEMGWQAGPHTLVLTLSGESMTTYRVAAVRVEREP